MTAQNETNSGESSTPNIEKDLSEAEKAEFGLTGTPPPPENDPNKSEEKKVDKPNQKQESSMRKIDNLIKNSLKDHGITGSHIKIWIVTLSLNLIELGKTGTI